MSRIKEGLTFKTHEECLEWFQALPLDEQAEVVTETQEIIAHLIEAFQSLFHPLLLVAAAKVVKEDQKKEN